MIIDNTYFYGDFYLTQAKPSLVPENSVNDKVQDYIDEHTANCLLRCFGYLLFEEFAEKLDSSKENGLKDGSNQKWDDLLNGATYIKNGKNVKWRGLRYKNIGSEKYKSLLVPYVYYHFQNETQTTSTPTGEKKVRAKNSTPADVNPVLARSWNKFVEQVQKNEGQPILISKPYAYGVDYYQNNRNQYITLNEFIKDMNEVNPNTYQNYTPEYFKRINPLGI